MFLYISVVCFSLLLSHISFMDIAQCFIYSSVDKHLSYFQFGAIMNTATLNIMYSSFGDMCFHFSWVNIEK